MMKYDFDTIVDRLDTNSVKWDIHPEVIPMWVADMDFKAAPFIMDAVRRRVEHGVFGYTYVPDRYYKSVADWFERRRGWHIEREWVQYISGLVPGLAVAIDALTEPGDKVLFQTPAYNCFFSCALNNGRRVAESPLIYDESGSQPTFRMDFDDLERKCSDPEVKLFILCNPHNPVGRVWTREELERLGDICLRYGVTIMSDEIHCDFNYPGFHTTSFLTLGEKYRGSLIVFTSPSKTFNVAGFQPANVIIPDPSLRAKYRQANRAAGYSEGNIMGMEAVKACYTRGDAWHAAVMEYLTANKDFMREFVEKNFPKAHFVEPEGTYLTWVDFSGYGFTDDELEHIMVDEAHLWLDCGKIFGPETAQFERFNIACPRSVLEKALTQLKNALDAHEKW